MKILLDISSFNVTSIIIIKYVISYFIFSLTMVFTRMLLLNNKCVSVKLITF